MSMRDTFVKIISENPSKADKYFLKQKKKHRKIYNKALKIIRIFHPEDDYPDDFLLEIMDILKR